MVNSYIADPHQKKLLKKWAPILESGKKIVSESTKVALAQVLENTRNFYKMHNMLNEAGIAHSSTIGGSPVAADGKGSTGFLKGDYAHPYADGGTGNYGDYYLPSVVIPMLRRIMPDLIANDLVGVQPLHGPVGYALAYRPIYGEKGGVGVGAGYTPNPAGLEIGYNPTDPRFTGASGEGVTGDDDMWDAYAGTSKEAWTKGVGQNTSAAEYANLWDSSATGVQGMGTYPTVSFGLVKSAVEAKTRKLAAHWSPELAEDMQAMHGIDVEREMVNTLTYEVGAEIDRQIITEMVKAAITGGSTSIWTPVSADGLDQMGRLATLLTQITVEAQQIAIRTRRGNANFVVTTPRVTALLQQMSINKYTSFKNTDAIPTVPDTGVGALAKVGLINDDSMLLVRDSYASNGANDYALLGYKGKQAGDSGIIYCPYIPLQLSKVLQPGSFTPSVGARTRYGVMSNPWDAKNFYHFMKIAGTYAPYDWNSSRQFIQTPSAINLDETNKYTQTVPGQTIDQSAEG
jgi:hypothetical protein